jgi:hypothetical protein
VANGTQQQQQQGQQQQQFRQKKKDPFQSWDFQIEGIAGINTTMPPNKIQDNEVVSIFNYLPISKTTVRKVASPSSIVTLPHDAIKMVNDIIAGSLVMFAILNDGSMGTITGGVYTQMQPAGTFSTSPNLIDITNWQNKCFLIVDNVKGYFSFNGTNVAALTAPTIPTLNYVSGGTIAQTTYYVKITYVNAFGETTPSPEASQLVPINNLLTVASPAGQSGATGWNVYVYVNAGAEVLQNSVPIAIGTNWTGPTSGLIIGISPPLGNTTGGFSLISTSLNGKAICVWTGRVFIANGRTLNYSAPLSYTDFNAIDGGGYFTINFTDLKQEVIRLSPYLDSFYIIGDHAIITLQGTTISNNPANWYQMELFNNSGSIYGCLLFNWNNMIFLVNEYGIWMIASTQNQKLDYEFDLTKVTINNFQGCITQIGNLNFYFVPVSAYDPVSNANQNMLLCYCIELRKFYFLYFQFPIQGIYATLSETDHSVYVWGNSQIYRLFSGSANVTGFLQFKTFDLGNPLVMKAVSYFIMNIYVLSNIPSFNITGLFSVINSQFNSLGLTPVLLGIGGAFDVFYINTYTTVILTDDKGNILVDENGKELTAQILSGSPALTFTNNYGVAIMGYTSGYSNYINEYVFSSFGLMGGADFTFIIQETSNAIYEFIDFRLEGFLGRTLR